MVALDACHTKNRKYPTQLFLATTLDGNNKLVILSYDVAPVENKGNWKWFLTKLYQAIWGIDSANIPFISDRQKRLLPASAEVFPGKVHGHSIVHLKANVRVNHGKSISNFFWNLVYAKSEKRFEQVLDRIQKHVGKGKKAVEYIRKIDPKLYSRYAFPLPQMGKVSSNPGECANSGILPIHKFALFKVLIEMWYYIMKRFKDRKREAMKREDFLSVPARRRHENNVRSFGQWQVQDNGGKKAIVQSVDQIEEYLVQATVPPTCTCYKLQDMCWPCQHIMAWEDIDGLDFMRHFHRCWWTTSLRRMYHPKMPCFVIDELNQRPTCNPPKIAVKRGRHRVVRMESGGSSRRNQALVEDEYVGADGELYTQYPLEDDPMLSMQVGKTPGDGSGLPKRRPSIVRGRGKITCRSCGIQGHNLQTCAKNVQQSPKPVEEEVAIMQHAPAPSQPCTIGTFKVLSNKLENIGADAQLWKSSFFVLTLSTFVLQNNFNIVYQMRDEQNNLPVDAGDVEVGSKGQEFAQELDSDEYWHSLALQAAADDDVQAILCKYYRSAS